MTEYDNTNTGALFKAKEQRSDKSPGYTGSINVDGQDYWLSAWVRESKAGERYFSLAVKPKEDKAPPKHGADAIDGDIPF